MCVKSKLIKWVMQRAQKSPNHGKRCCRGICVSPEFVEIHSLTHPFSLTAVVTVNPGEDGRSDQNSNFDQRPNVSLPAPLAQAPDAPAVFLFVGLPATESVTLKDRKLIPTVATHSSNHFEVK